MKRIKKFHIQTFGCQMNEKDSETLAGMLVAAGYEGTDDRDEADVAIINTCSIRENADKRFFGTLGQLKRMSMEKDGFVTCVCGCMMQQQHIVDEVKEKYPWVDIVFGTHNIHEFPELLRNAGEQKEMNIALYQDRDGIVEGLPSQRKFKHKGYVNITYGCNNFCTYCIVPYTRGRERSRDSAKIYDEVKRMAADGVKEITLLGQNVNSYQWSDVSFAQLLQRLDDIDGLERIRFMTSHPKDISDELIECYGKLSKLCTHIHLPVQSGSDEVLRRMNRHYGRKDYLEAIAKLREACPEIGITTDIIVGFPGEREEDFQATLDLVEEVGFDFAFTFMYSQRKGTPAEGYGDQIDEDVKHERFNRLVESINAGAAAINQNYLGKTVKVLVDGRSKKEDGIFTGRSETFKTVNFSGGNTAPGDVVKVKIKAANTFSLFGEIVD